MSKESYARGFCKAAEAAGVDPRALAKFAAETKNEQPKYKTDGYSPRMIRNPSTERIDIPYLNSLLGSVSEKTLPELSSLLSGGRLYGPPWTDKNLMARMALNPKFKNWVDAHTNAAQKAVAPLVNIKYPDDDKIPKDIGDMLSKLYHDEMKRTTSAPPVQVSAPANK